MTTRPIDRGARTAVVAPGAALFAGLVVAAAVLGPTLPARIAQHFGGDGQPDGYGSPWPFFWVTAASPPQPSPCHCGHSARGTDGPRDSSCSSGTCSPGSSS